MARRFFKWIAGLFQGRDNRDNSRPNVPNVPVDAHAHDERYMDWPDDHVWPEDSERL